MKVYLVNLDRDTDRFASIDGQLKKLGVEYERVSAVYGKDLSKDEIARCFNSFRWWCAMGRPVAPAEIGCALSHYNIYRRMEAEKIPYCCILEDDIAVSPQFISILQLVRRRLDQKRPQVFLLNDHQNRYAGFSLGIHWSRFGGMCTDGYVLTQAAARNLLAANLPIIVPCDTWGRWVRQGRIELYHAVPAVVRQMQNVFGTSTSEGRVSVSELSLLRRIGHKVKRIVGKMLDMFLIKVTGR